MTVVLNIQCTSELSEALVKNVHPWVSCPISAAIMVFVWHLSFIFLNKFEDAFNASSISLYIPEEFSKIC